jgi:hypothetical protein
LVDIAKLQEGQSLRGYNSSSQTVCSVVITRIVKAQSRELYRVSLPGEVLEVTPEHPFLVNGRGWVKAKNLQTNDALMSVDGKQVVIQGIGYIALDHPVYVFSLSVEDPHVYTVGVNKVVVHNK